MEWIAGIFAALWVGGWIALLRSTSAGPDARWYQRLGGAVLLFFIWPPIAGRMNTDR